MPDEVNDAFVHDTARGYTAKLGLHAETFRERDDAYAWLREQAGPDYNPCYWFVNERGTVDQTDDHGNFVEP